MGCRKAALGVQAQTVPTGSTEALFSPFLRGLPAIGLPFSPSTYSRRSSSFPHIVPSLPEDSTFVNGHFNNLAMDEEGFSARKKQVVLLQGRSHNRGNCI